MSEHERKQKLALAVVDFLNQSMQDGTIKEDDKEGIEVAVQCIGEAFGVDLANTQQVEKLSVKPASLLSVFDLFLKTRDKMGSAAASTSATPATPPGPTSEDKAAAEKLKQEGNAAMTRKEHDAAIELYTSAIEKDGTNPIYYSNRAAAYSSKNDHLSAIADAESAIALSPTFAKAYSRLGHAHYSIGDYAAAADAFRRGLEVEPGNASMKQGLTNSEARVDSSSSSSAATTTGAGADAGAGGLGGLGGMADMLRNLGGGGGGGGASGGMPDLASMMQNPMMMQMAQQMMANGGMERLMNNPNVANMMNRMRSGGGMPSMEELMSDPALRDMASSFAGLGGGAPPGSA